MCCADAGMLQYTLVICLLCAISRTSASLFARECRQQAALNADHSNQDLHPSDDLCNKHVCGAIPETDVKFNERLSPQCTTLLDSYKSKWSRQGLSNAVAPHPCSTSKKALGPHGPVLISSKYPTATFAMCTIPKSGCTNFRKLLSTVMLHPDPMPSDSFSQWFNPHMWPYPTVWHYDVPQPSCDTNPRGPGCSGGAQGRSLKQDSLPTRLQDQDADVEAKPDRKPASTPEKRLDRLPDSVPSFMVGRNPYVRVLSGFLDKMVHDPLRHDQWTYKSTNERLGLHSETRWFNTVLSFQMFVRALVQKGLEGQVCTHVLYVK